MPKQPKLGYVDGFVMLVKKSKLAEYKKVAKEGAKLWIKLGALDYKECVQDDMRMLGGGIPFPKLTKRKPDEVVIFSYILYKSRAHRDAVNKKMMSDPSMDGMTMDDMPFDIKRMSQGGFKVIVSS